MLKCYQYVGIFISFGDFIFCGVGGGARVGAFYRGPARRCGGGGVWDWLSAQNLVQEDRDQEK